MNKHCIAAAAVSMLCATSAAAQDFGSLIGELFGAITGQICGEESVLMSEKQAGTPQQNLAAWGIEHADYSGITPIGDGRYAVVSDKAETDGFFIWKIDQNPEDGSIISVENEGFFPNSISPVAERDCEGIAYFPRKRCVFISGESDGRITGYDLSGQRNGLELNVPDIFRHTAPNMGLEAVAYGGRGKGSRFWTTTETMLPSDGSPAGPEAPGKANILRIQSFKNNLKPSSQYAYRMDAGRSSDFGSTYVFGVPDLCALPDGSLLVLEREANVPRLYLGAEVTCRLYRVRPRNSGRISSRKKLDRLPEKAFLSKTPVASWTTRVSLSEFSWANYEGMCLGRTLSDGRQTLILISDSQGGYGKGPIRLQDYIKVICL